MTVSLEDALFALLAELPPGKSVSPEEVAKSADPENWRRRLGNVRSMAVGLARQRKLVILRHNKPADPERFKGVYRLRLPLEGDVVPTGEDQDGED